MRITRCTPDDLDDLVWIARKTFRETFAGQNTAKDMAAYLASAFSPEKLAAELRCPDSALFLARELGAPVGYLQLNRGRAPTEHSPENAAEIQRIYVLSGAKGRGVGSQLMRLAEKTAREWGCGMLWLGVWEHNLPAQRFYRSHGFERFSQHIFQLGSDAQTDFLLKKELPPLPARQEIRIRPAAESDYPAAERIMQQVQALHVSLRPDIYKPYKIALPREEFDRAVRENRFFAAVCDGEVVGILHLQLRSVGSSTQVSRRVLFVDTLAVDESLRGKGVGQALLNHARSLRDELKLDGLELQVNARNRAARAFYARCGFTEKSVNLELR